MKEFTHFNEQGMPKMVNVSDKAITSRRAIAFGRVSVNNETFALIKSGGIKKGDVLSVAQVAGIMGAKKTPEIIAMCHPVNINGIDIKIELNEKETAVEITAEVDCTGKTGVEMEALCAVSIAALNIYDMCKAVQRDIAISEICLLEKSGGVHGDYKKHID